VIRQKQTAKDRRADAARQVSFEIVTALVRSAAEQKALPLHFSRAVDVDGSGKSTMQRRARANWTLVIVTDDYRAEGDKLSQHAIRDGARSSDEDEGRQADRRFMIAAVIALALPAVIGVGLYVIATAALRVI
jgi:hypothetical protein